MAMPTSPNDLTRQQLDELDALLQRMLALPIHANDPAPAPVAQLPELVSPVSRPASNWRADAPMPVGRPNLVMATVPEMVATYAEAKPTPALQYGPVVTTGTLRGVDAPAMPYGYKEPEPLPDYDPIGTNFDVNPFASSTVLAPTVAEPARRSVPVPFWPIFSVNWMLEWLLGWFGPIGHLLTRPAMKTLLGFTGVLLMLAAGYWCARGLGYVTWPALPSGL